MTGKETSG
jgi:hypothetical protein